MRAAIMSDIHGNGIALEAVLADIEGMGGLDAYWILGDLAALGPDPIGVLEVLDALPNAQIVRGNTDCYVVTGDRPPPTLAEAQADPKLVSIYADVQASFAWTAGMRVLAFTGKRPGMRWRQS